MGQLRIRWTVVVATILASGLFLRLGWWQWQKSIDVQTRYESYEARSRQTPMRLSALLMPAEQAQHLPLLVRGEYESTAQFFLDNKQENGVAGVNVITPLRIEGSSTRVLVNRGWVAWGTSRRELPKVPVPSGIVEVHGLAEVPTQQKMLGISDPEAGSTQQLRMRLDIDAYTKQTGYEVQPFVLLQNPADANDSLIRHWQPPENKSTMHRGYAIQWLLITLGLIVFVIVAGYRRKEK